MGYILFALFIGVPVIEIAVFIRVGGWIGLWPTIAIVILTAAIGSWLLRLQGLNTLARVQDAFQRGEMPVAELFNGLCLLLAGALLLTPGFVTDAVGFLLFLPSFRMFLVGYGWRFLQKRGNFQVWSAQAKRDHGESAGDARGPVIEGEFTQIGEDRDDKPKNGR
jgi:UPF0716 protein FxsA